MAIEIEEKVVVLKWQLLAKFILALMILLLTLGVAKHYFSWKKLLIPVVIIYSKDNNMGEVDKNKVKNCLELNSNDSYLSVLDEHNASLINDIPSLLEQLDNSSEGAPIGRHLFKLDSPSSHKLKELRSIINASFAGEKRGQAFMGVTVVLDLDAHYPSAIQQTQEERFRDDVFYINKSFGGLGFLVNDIDENWCKILRNTIQDPFITTDAFYY
jgi:diadenosine tetraphosphatase ApaH/serine/threonine PP2A family protein phosphatase